ncbi:MAG: hypothetical protein ABSC23_05985 [Bryobacteraceae bacterium]
MSPTPTYEPPQRSGLTTALVAGAIVALFGANIYLYVQIGDVRTQMTAEMAKNRETIAAEFANLRDASSASTASQTRSVEQLKADLETAKAQARTLSSQAKAEATAHAEDLARQLTAAQAKQQQQVASEINGVKQSADTANAKIADVSTDVGAVKGTLAITNADLQKTIADLKSVRGDLGVQSGLIATNGNELAALRRLGDRNYFEFNIKKTKDRQRVGDASTGVTVLLKSTDPKKNTYTIELMADDKVTPKKDKGVNEPVQFYTSKAKQPFELVVNKVQKNVIVGYLSTPKDTSGR